MEKRIELEKRGRNPSDIKELVLDSCKSTQVVGLSEEFSNLESLSLINVGLTNLKGFPKLPNLKKLELSENRISGGLNYLNGSPKLTILNLGGNKIATLEALEPLKEFKSLNQLDLFNNEVTSLDDYREKVYAMLPGLVFLDGFDQNDKEVESEEENGVSKKYEDGESDLSDDEEDEDDGYKSNLTLPDEEEGEVGLSYLQNSIDEESEGEDYEPGEAHDDDSDVDIEDDDEDDDDEKPKGQKRKLEDGE